MTDTMPAPALQDCRIVLRMKEPIDVKVCRTVPGTEEDLRRCELVSL